MAALVTTAEVQEYLETDLTNAQIDDLIADADRLIVRAYGPHTADGDVTEQDRGLSRRLHFDRPFGAIVEVVEYDSRDEPLTLAVDDFRVWDDGFTLERLDTGTNPRTFWNVRVDVTGTPADDDGIRKRVTLDLCRLSAEWDSQSTSRRGDFSTSSSDYEGQRDAILARCSSGSGLVG